MNPANPPSAPGREWRDFLLLPAVAVSVAWGLRGFIGGGELGAMIPGVLVALVIARALELPAKIVGRVAAFGAVGIGFGGQETYGQTVGFVTGLGEMFARGLVGLAVKGAVWGLVGGAVIGVALTLGSRARRTLWGALLCLVGGTWLGWRIIDQPRLLYFSNLLDRPRPELWAGLLLGGLALLAWFAVAQRAVARVAGVFALCGALGGGLGFSLGGATYAGSVALGWQTWYPGWKHMEFVFGLLLGASLGLAAWLTRDAVGRVVTVLASEEPCERVWLWPLVGAALAGLWVWACSFLPIRFDYTAAGAVLLAAAFASERAAWQIAITVTVGAFLLDVVRWIPGDAPAGWFLAVLALALAGAVGRWLGTRLAAGLELTTSGIRVVLWMAVAAAVVKAARHPTLSSELIAVTAVFLGGAMWVTVLTKGSLTDARGA